MAYDFYTVIQQNDNDMEMWLAEIKLRAMLKFGELSKEIPKSTPANSRYSIKSNVAFNKKTKLEEIGSNQRIANRCENLTDILIIKPCSSTSRLLSAFFSASHTLHWTP